MKNKKFFVTGGNGFIGSRIVGRLVSQGYWPSLLLRKNSGRERLLPILGKVKIFEADLRDKESILDILSKVNPDVIFHLAGNGVYSYNDMSVENIQSMIGSNIYGTMNLLHAAENTNCESFINTGSCFEYGSNASPFSEESILTPVNMYGVTKVASTLFAQVFSKKSKFSLTTVRPFTVYGPGEDERRFMSTVIRQCLQGKNLSLTKQKIVRDYIYIDDVVDAYFSLIEFGGKLSGKIINVSTGKGTLLEDVAKTIIQKTKANVAIDLGSYPSRDGEVLSLVGDAKKAGEILKWKAQYSLKEGICKTIAWTKQTLNL